MLNEERLKLADKGKYGLGAVAGNCLAWSTAQEVKSASFVVEASADGQEFAAVAGLVERRELMGIC